MGQAQSSKAKTLPGLDTFSGGSDRPLDSPKKIKPSKNSDTKNSSRSTSTSISISKMSDKKDTATTPTVATVKRALVNVDDFPANDILPFETWEGQKLCQEDANIRKAFMQYIHSMHWMESMTPRLMELLSRRISATELSDHITFNEYMMYHRNRSTSTDQKDRDEIAAKMMRVTQLKARESMDVSTFRKSSLVQTCFNTEHLKVLLLATVWPLFRHSPEFAAVSPYNMTESGATSEVHSEADNGQSAAANASPMNRQSPAPSPTGSKMNDLEKIKRVKEILYQATGFWKGDDMEQRLASGKWLDAVLQAVEENNFSISIASAAAEKRGFPLMFVNKAFEKMSQYDRAELLGRSCNVLQGPKTEKDYIYKLGDTLSKGLGLKMALSNNRKDGSEFINFLALRPVFDKEDNFTHLVGVQYDIGQDNASMKDVKMIEDLMLLVCNVMRA